MGFVYCDKCKVWHTNKMDFCDRCGQALTKKAKETKKYDDSTVVIYALCDRCEKKIKEKAKFCVFCGLKREVE